MVDAITTKLKAIPTMNTRRKDLTWLRIILLEVKTDICFDQSWLILVIIA
ncbi:hypothetical protein ES708_30062 [subsurface metagenome]